MTHHSIAFAERTLAFTAIAGSETLSDMQGVAQAQIATIAYTLDGTDPSTRPVTFVFNGGPGSASAWLQLGMMGPWRVRMSGDALAPSAPPVVMDNPDTWLDFTDLVFVDPVGTGYSRFLVPGDDVRKKYWSVNGDVAAMAEAIRQWLEQHRRVASPKYVAGESYGGIRGPRVVRELLDAQGIGVSGLVLISPKLDYGGRGNALDVMEWVEQLPTLVASARARLGPVTRTQMADVESYAIGAYVTDLLRGESDIDAVARRTAEVTRLTGLDPALLRERHGKIDDHEYLRARDRDRERIGSPYDATVTVPDPDPSEPFGRVPDPLVDALAGPVTSAMLELYADQLHWRPEGTYTLLNRAVTRAWDFGQGQTRPESLSALRTALALDPHFQVLIGHGLFDFVTPYFTTQLLLNTIPPGAGLGRVRFVVYPGGHMFYSNDESRTAFRAEAAALFAPR